MLPAIVPFFAFRIMVGLGVIMLALVVLGWGLRFTGRLYNNGWFLKLLMWSGPIGFLAVLAGWTTTEVGRQPWTVYGVMRTANSVTPSLTGTDVLLSLLGYVRGLSDRLSGGSLVHAADRQARHDAAIAAPVGGGRPAAPVKAPPDMAGAP